MLEVAGEQSEDHDGGHAGCLVVVLRVPAARLVVEVLRYARTGCFSLLTLPMACSLMTQHGGMIMSLLEEEAGKEKQEARRNGSYF